MNIKILFILTAFISFLVAFSIEKKETVFAHIPIYIYIYITSLLFPCQGKVLQIVFCLKAILAKSF